MAKKDNYLKAQKEFDSGKKDSALWTQALAISNGDEDKAKYKYIELRVKEIRVANLLLWEVEAKYKLPTFLSLIIVSGCIAIVNLGSYKQKTLAWSAYLGELIGFMLAEFFIAYILIALFAKSFFDDAETPRATAWKTLTVVGIIIMIIWIFTGTAQTYFYD